MGRDSFSGGKVQIGISQYPASNFKSLVYLNSGVTKFTSFTATIKTALKQFYAGGTGIGEQILYSYYPTNTVFVSFGDFESLADVANWPYYSAGGAGTGIAAYSTAQAYTGTGSVSITFTKSDINNSNGVRQTFTTPQDFSGYRYVTAQFYNTLSAGAAYTRTISIVLTDVGGNTKKFDVSGLSTAAPFNTSGWIKITGELANPTSSTGTVFDNTQIYSMELRHVDSANRAGTIYWDTAKLESEIVPIFPIYHQANNSINIPFDPVVVVNIGDILLLAQVNNDTVRKEFFAQASGVAL